MVKWIEINFLLVVNIFVIYVLHRWHIFDSKAFLFHAISNLAKLHRLTQLVSIAQPYFANSGAKRGHILHTDTDTDTHTQSAIPNVPHQEWSRKLFSMRYNNGTKQKTPASKLIYVRKFPRLVYDKIGLDFQEPLFLISLTVSTGAWET